MESPVPPVFAAGAAGFAAAAATALVDVTARNVVGEAAQLVQINVLRTDESCLRYPELDRSNPLAYFIYNQHDLCIPIVAPQRHRAMYSQNS